MLGDDDKDTTEDWLLINLDAPHTTDTELVINERAWQLLRELASSYMMTGPEDETTELSDYDRFLLDEAVIPSVSKPHTLGTSVSDPTLRNISDQPPTSFTSRMKDRWRRLEYIHIRKGGGSLKRERIKQNFVGVVNIRKRLFLKHSFSKYDVTIFTGFGKWFW